jgi:2-deoxy-D-gluconate 3-dehydrogenase
VSTRGHTESAADASGIGQAIAIALSQAGAHVVLAQRDVSNTSTRDKIVASGGRCDIIKCDLEDLKDCESVFDRAVEAVGEVQVLVNCGGMLKRTDSVDVKQEEWQQVGVTPLGQQLTLQVLNVNLNSLFIICQGAGRHMIPRRRGHIINVASLNSFIGGIRVASYAAAKGAVGTLTKALSNEWAKHNITVNAIAPGSVATDM